MNVSVFSSALKLKGKMPAKSLKTSTELLLDIRLSFTDSKLRASKEVERRALLLHQTFYTKKENQFQSNNLPNDKTAGDRYVSDCSNYLKTAILLQCTFFKCLQTFRIFFFFNPPFLLLQSHFCLFFMKLRTN